jgi:hypothetical protein
LTQVNKTIDLGDETRAAAPKIGSTVPMRIAIPPTNSQEPFIMKSKSLFVSLVVSGLLATPVAFAQAPKAGQGEASLQPPTAKSTMSRAQVKAECDAALKAGKVPQGECAVMPEGKSTKTRAQVKAECDAALKAGKVPQGECAAN